MIGYGGGPMFYAQRQEASGPDLNTHAQWRHVFIAIQGRAGLHAGIPVKVYQHQPGSKENQWPEHPAVAWLPEKAILAIGFIPSEIEILKIEVSFDGGFPEVYFVRLLDAPEPDTKASYRFTAGGRSYMPDGKTNSMLAKVAG